MTGLRKATHSAVVVAVREAEPVVAEHRLRFDPAAGWGVPAHVTVLYPFVHPSVIDDRVVRRLAEAVASVPAFVCAFPSCGWFDDDVLWLAPEPAAPFRALSNAVWQAFPEHPAGVPARPCAPRGVRLRNDVPMPVDPHISGLLELISASGYPPLHHGTPEDGRKALRAMSCDLVKPEDVIGVGEVRSLTVPGGAGDREARLYRPDGEGPWPTTVFLHGGGFVVGDLDTHDQVCRRLCREAATVVLSVDYRLAPEHPFPAGLEDALAATRWARANLAELGGDDRLAIGGDSAGGNLAAVVTQAMPEDIAAQLLIYPSVDVAGEYDSRVENAEGYFLELAMMEWFFTHYTTEVEGVDPHDPRLSPLRAPSMSGLPPAVVVTAEFDPLRDEGEAYADRLVAEGVTVERARYDGMIHGFVDMAALSPAAEAAVADTVARFSRLLRR